MGRVVDAEELLRIREDARAGSMRLVFTNGCFDIVHRGHTDLFKAARELGDILVVAINSDASVARLKGSKRPIVAQEDRAAVLAALRAVEGDGSFLVSVLLTLLVFAVVQVIQDSLITPRVMGKATGLRPVAILLGVFVWGKLLGFLGLLLAIPLTCLGIAYYRRYVLPNDPVPGRLSAAP